MLEVYLVLYLLSAVFFGLAAFGVVARKVDFVALGLLVWVLVPLFQTLQKL